MIEALDHMVNLGVRYLYLTPIFAADSPHRYDCYDFRRIDPLLGTEADFHELVKAAHRRDIRIVLDVVLNHCGIAFWAFDDVLQNQQNSRYCDWFVIDRFPIEVQDFAPRYRCWWNLGQMPEFDLENPKVRRYLIDSCIFWLEEFEVDGWRVDVSSELPPGFLGEFRERLSACRPDAVLVGENWKDASLFLSGRAVLSGVTNYRYWWELFVPLLAEQRINVEAFARRLMEIVFQYPHNRLLSSWNMISSHDVPRFSEISRSQERQKCAVALQIFLPGVPVVYYGDEVGLSGGDDPDNRRCMPWDRDSWDLDMLDWHRRLLRVRIRSAALQCGHLSVVSADDETGLIVLGRTHGRERIFLAMNLGDRRQVATGLGSDLRDALTGDHMAVPVVQPAGMRLFEQEG
jgi:cyclomaltodextrinase / maltogenic alpha-amylase / neopullulanase